MSGAPLLQSLVDDLVAESADLDLPVDADRSHCEGNRYAS